MAKTRTVVQSRTNPTTDTISFPVLTYSDAAQRDDLRDIHKATSQQPPEQGLVAQWDFPRPQTADTGTDRKAPPGLGATFDFRLTAPPDEAIPSGAHSGGSPLGPQTIGIALGSPGMLHSKEALSPPRFNTSIFVQTQTGTPTPPRKSSKWKKIGGFFRAKNALASPTQIAHPGPLKQPGQKETPSANQQQIKKRKGSNGEWPRIQVDSNNSSSQRSREFSLSNRINTKGNSENQGLRLEVDIPDIQMERYSVMFSNVMNKNQRPNLLARRAKTLDSLSVPSNQPFLAATAKPPPVPIRRATSPARSSFTLFPASQPSKAAQALGSQNLSRGHSPLIRSNTVSLESPSRSPLEPTHRAIPDNNGVSSLESPIMKHIFNESSNTPRSSNSYIRWEDKPLPAIKPEPPTQPRSRTMSPQEIRAVQSSLQQQKSTPQTDKNPPVKERSRRERPNLTVKTGREPPLPPAKDAKEAKNKSSSKSSLSNTAPPPKITAELVNITASPKEMSSDPKPDLANPPRAEHIRIPLVAEPEQLDSKETNVPIPTIEVSTARSVSLKKGKRQVLIPIGSRVDHFNANERFVERKALTPHITDVQYGHKHAVSQHLQIESL